jgi:two-component system, NarL family, response regulator NreC
VVLDEEDPDRRIAACGHPGRELRPCRRCLWHITLAPGVGLVDPRAVRPATSPTTVLLADDHAIVRASLGALLERDPRLRVVGEADRVERAERLARVLRPAVLLLDLAMPGERPLDALPRLVRRLPETAVVVLTMNADPGVVRVALQRGARGYVLKDAAEAELVEALVAVAAGDRYVARELGPRLPAEPAPERPGGLSERELAVLRLLALGHTSGEIARELQCSRRTVEGHRARIALKLRCAGRPDLVRFALRHQLLTPAR